MVDSICSHPSPKTRKDGVISDAAEASEVHEFSDEELTTKQEVDQHQVDNSGNVSKPLECKSSEDLIKSEFNDDDFPSKLSRFVLLLRYY